jgi:hypothetical protein
MCTPQARFKGVVAQLSLRAACTQSPTATRTGEGWLIVQWVTPVGTFVVHIRPDVEHFWETIKQTPPAPVSDDPPSYVCRPLDVDKIDRSFSAFAHGAFTGAVVPWFRGMQTFVQLVRLATKLARIPVGDISFPSVCCGGTDGKSLGSLLQVVGALAAAYACSAVLQPDDKSDANTGPVPLSVDATTGAAQGAVGDCEVRCRVDRSDTRCLHPCYSTGSRGRMGCHVYTGVAIHVGGTVCRRR